MQVGIFLYITLMVGIIMQREGGTLGAAGKVAAMAYVFLLGRWWQLTRNLDIERLPLHQLALLDTDGAASQDSPSSAQSGSAADIYVRPELHGAIWASTL